MVIFNRAHNSYHTILIIIFVYLKILKESCYVVSFAVIMLNTSLHNPSVKEKQTCDQFIKMCKDTSKQELQDAMLKVRLYLIFWHF